jgi:hypothetical protein
MPKMTQSMKRPIEKIAISTSTSLCNLNAFS